MLPLSRPHVLLIFEATANMKKREAQTEDENAVEAMMIAAEELRLMDAKELSAYSMATPEIEDIQVRSRVQLAMSDRMNDKK